MKYKVLITTSYCNGNSGAAIHTVITNFDDAEAANRCCEAVRVANKENRGSLQQQAIRLS